MLQSNSGRRQEKGENRKKYSGHEKSSPDSLSVSSGLPSVHPPIVATPRISR